MKQKLNNWFVAAPQVDYPSLYMDRNNPSGTYTLGTVSIVKHENGYAAVAEDGKCIGIGADAELVKMAVWENVITYIEDNNIDASEILVNFVGETEESIRYAE